jgi:hypothetical protein
MFCADRICLSSFAELARVEGVFSESLIQKWVLRRYFLFIVLNFFFLTIISGSFFTIVNDLSPSALPRLLGQAVPSVSTFFMSYILLRALTGQALFLLRPGPWIVSNFLRAISTSKRQTRYAKDWSRYQFYFGKSPHDLLLPAASNS